MISKVIKKTIRMTRIGTLKRIFKYRKFSKRLNLKNGFVTNIDGIKLNNSNLYSTSDDSKIFIRFNFPIKKLIIDIELKSDFLDDDIDLFYSNINKKKAEFSYNESFKIGKTNGKRVKKIILFPQPVKFIRLDFGNHESILNLNYFNIKLEKKVNDDYYEYNELIVENKNRNKIVIITHALNETGAPLLAFNIAKEFKAKNYDVFCISLSDGYLEENYLEENIMLLSLHQDPMSKKIYNVKQFENIIKILRKKGYINVITNTIIAGVATPVLKKYNYKIISLIHEMGKSIELYNMVQGGRDINTYADKIVFPDKIVKNEFYDIFKKNFDKSLIQPQGLYKTPERIQLDKKNIYDKYQIPENSKIIVGSGTADFRKGIDLFLLAAQRLINLESDNEYHFIWAGKIIDNDLKEWYDLQFKKSGLKNRFHNIEFIKDKKEYQNLISCSDVFWLTSREDPFPSVMIEALQFGTPVVAFKNSGGANTLLENGRGILISDFNLDKMVKETYELINDEKRYNEVLKNAQMYIEKNLNFKNYINILEKEFFDLDKISKNVFADLSVIIPNYNYEEFLEMRINSVINQTVKPKEIIFLDDVSTDNSLKIASKLLEAAEKKYGIKYKIIANKVNLGCFKQWLKGLNYAQYPYVWIAEADDYIESNFVETLMTKFQDDSVVLAYSQSQVINEYGEVVDYKYTDYTKDLSKDKWNKDFKEEGIRQIKKYFSQKNIIPNASSTIIRKNATIGLEKYLKEYNIAGDWLTYIYILTKGKIAYSPKILNSHRRHTKSIINKKEESKEFIEEILKIKRFVVENIELTDDELNNLLLSIEKINNYYEIITKNSELKDLYVSIIKLISEKRKKHNIFITIPDLNVGGGQTVAIRIANSIHKYYNVFIINARPFLEDKIMKNMISDKVKILKYNDVKSLKIYGEILNVRGIISFIWWSDKLTYQVFGDTNIPHILSMHGCYEMLLHNSDVDSFFNTDAQNVLLRANKIVYTADKNKEIFKVLNMEDNKKISKIDNGFVLGDYPKKSREELGIAENDFVFGLVARAIPEKGYEEAIKAIMILNETEKEKAHLILVGGSSYIDELKKKYDISFIHFIDKFNLPLEWIGWEEIFDVGLLPSYFKSESLPTVIVEYLFLNKPVIATDIAEIKTMIQNDTKEAGITIPLKNGKADINKLVEAMKQIKNDSEFYKKLQKNCKELSKRFDMDNCIEEYRKLIEECNEKK